MKRNTVFFILLFFISAFFIYPVVEGKIQLKEKKSFYYAFVDGQGSYKQMPEKIQKFMKEFFSLGLVPLGPLITVYFNSPEVVPESELKWSIGFPVNKGEKLGNNLKQGIYTKKTVMEYNHTGPYEKLPEVYQKLMKYATKQKLEIILPSYEFYLNSPLEVKPEELKTRIEIPVKKIK